jgi:hypothetical protein
LYTSGNHTFSLFRLGVLIDEHSSENAAASITQVFSDKIKLVRRLAMCAPQTTNQSIPSMAEVEAGSSEGAGDSASATVGTSSPNQVKTKAGEKKLANNSTTFDTTLTKSCDEFAWRTVWARRVQSVM